ncbi:MAG: hypothetical protein ACRDMV_24880 [Streptosporangiales bacterium]
MKRMLYALLGFMLMAAGTMLVSGSSAAAATAHSNRAATSLSSHSSVTVAPDTSRREPPPNCGYHFTLRRNGSYVRASGVGLNAFGKGYKLVWASAHGKAYGPYNARSSANFEIDTGSSNPTDVVVDLTNDENTLTLCSSTYHV